MKMILSRLENEKNEIVSCLKGKKIPDEELKKIMNIAQLYFMTNDDITDDLLSLINRICPNYMKNGGKRKKTLKSRYINKRIRNKTGKKYRGGEGEGITSEELEEDCCICLEKLSVEPAIVIHPGGQNSSRHIIHRSCLKNVIQQAINNRTIVSCPVCRGNVTWVCPEIRDLELQTLRNLPNNQDGQRANRIELLAGSAAQRNARENPREIWRHNPEEYERVLAFEPRDLHNIARWVVSPVLLFFFAQILTVAFLDFYRGER
jgi:hypothetical protein